MALIQAKLEASATRGRGRPKDPLLEEKTLYAAAQVYGRHGWSGFSFDAVAREAGVGKSTLYARWTDAADLLSYLIERRWQALDAIDTGALESDLLSFGRHVLSRYRETGGGIAWHLRRDMATVPDLFSRLEQTVNRTNTMCRDILRRAQDRGELREGVSLSLTTELLTSALETHAAQSQNEPAPTQNADDTHIVRIVDLLCMGIKDSTTGK